MQDYNKPGDIKRIRLKIDLVTTFDSLRWDFLLTTMKIINIPGKFLEWCKSYFCNPTFSISINGSISGYFKRIAGIRQGDYLSPSLFIIVMNVLSLMFTGMLLEVSLGIINTVIKLA